MTFEMNLESTSRYMAFVANHEIRHFITKGDDQIDSLLICWEFPTDV